MEPQPESPRPTSCELERKAGNLPPPVKRALHDQPSFSVRSEREDKTEADTEAA
jgi:hypothetical protein